MKTLGKITYILSVILTIAVYWAGSIALHGYTIYLVYQSYGIFWGIISFFCPVISQIVMFILSIVNHGFNLYCILCVVFLLGIALTIALSYVTTIIEDKIKAPK